jgi:putative ABC transport system permease protein
VDPLWRAAPTVLLRFRSLFLALAAGILVVAVVAAAAPLFVSAAENDLLASEIANPTVTPHGMGIAYTSTRLGFDERFGGVSLAEARGEAFDLAVADQPDLGSVEVGVFGPVVEVTGTDGRTPPTGEVTGRLFAGTDALAHVEVLRGREGPGVWLPDLVADPLRADPGDVVLMREGGRSVRVTVDGVYASLFTQPRQGYWRVWNDDIYPCPEFDCSAPPQFILTSLSQIVPLARAVGARDANFTWQAPSRTDPPPTLSDAERLASFAAGLQRDMSRDGPLHPLFRCCGRLFPRWAGIETSLTSNARTVVDQVRQRMAAVRGPMSVLAIAGLAIALTFVAAAGVFATLGRPIEAGVLTVRGWGPARFGAKTAVESALPALLGGTAGVLLAFGVIAAAGPDAPIDPAVRVRAGVAGLLATIGSLAVIAAVSAVVFVGRHEHRRRAGRLLAIVPWEVVPLGLAWWSIRRLETGGGIVVTEGIQRPQPSVFLVPLLLALGIGILSARICRVALRGARARPGSGAGASWLAFRRLDAAPGLTSVVVVAGTVTVAVALTSLSIVASLRQTVEAKARVFVGSQVQVRIASSGLEDPAFPYPLTRVSRFREAGYLDATTARFDLLAIDPSTLAHAAFWRDGFADRPLPELLAALGQGPPGSMPVLVSGLEAPRPTSVNISGLDVPVRVVATTRSFPGTSSKERPLLVVDRAAFEEAMRGVPDPLLLPRVSTELWIDGPPERVLDDLDLLGASPQLVLTAEQVRSIPWIDVAVQTFLVLQVLGFAAVGLLIVVAIVYLSARQRARAVSTVLSERMGVTGGVLRRASVIELGSLLGVSYAAGALVATISAAVVVPTIDPLPSIPPGVFTVVPVVALGLTGCVLAVAAAIGGTGAHRGARRASAAEVMRVAG